MGNTLCCFTSSSSLVHTIGNANSSSQFLDYPRQSLPPKTQGYHAFINHHGLDTKKSIGSLLFRNLPKRGLEVFFDRDSIKVGYNIPETIELAIRKSSVHIAILSVNYADSEDCLDELCLMVKTGAPIIPVFWKIRPDEVAMENKDGVYVQALRRYQLAGKIETGTMMKWEEALRRVSNIKGVVFSKGDDMGEKVDEIADCVLELINKKSSKRRSFHAAI